MIAGERRCHAAAHPAQLEKEKSLEIMMCRPTTMVGRVECYLMSFAALLFSCFYIHSYLYHTLFNFTTPIDSLDEVARRKKW